MKIKQLMGVFLLLLALVFPVSAVDYNLSGHVLDSSGSTISGAAVQIVEGASTSSDAGGYYLFATVSADNYTVYAEKSGHYRQIRAINLYQDTVQNFTLSAPNYTVSDVDDIVIDITGTAMVEVKGDMPTLVDLGVLYLIVILLMMVIGGIVALFYIVPKLFSKRKGRR